MNIYFDSIGCRLNQAEIEKLASQFKTAGHRVVASADEADLVIINTCSVTAEAASDSREKARQAYVSGAKGIVLTGCWATLEPQAAASLPGVVRVVNNREKLSLAKDLPGAQLPEFDREPIAREPLPGVHHRTRAFIKVQDGCNNFCTFCVTRIARGSGISVPVEQVVEDIHAAEQGGVKEIVLSGVHLGSWGVDQKQGERLRDLIRKILDQTSVRRIRLSSLEPWDLDEAFFDLWQDPRLCRHLHLPLQSGSAGVLRRMARNTTPESYRQLVTLARQRIPGLALTTDIIVGFPGESDEEFEESLSFVKEMHFAGGHVFKYSPREGTAAARLPGRIHGTLAHERSRRMRALLQQSAGEYASQFIGQKLDVLWESTTGLNGNGWQMHGLTDNYLKVNGTLLENRWNQIDRVKVITYEDNRLKVQSV